MQCVLIANGEKFTGFLWSGHKDGEIGNHQIRPFDTNYLDGAVVCMNCALTLANHGMMKACTSGEIMVCPDHYILTHNNTGNKIVVSAPEFRSNFKVELRVVQ